MRLRDYSFLQRECAYIDTKVEVERKDDWYEMYVIRRESYCDGRGIFVKIPATEILRVARDFNESDHAAEAHLLGDTAGALAYALHSDMADFFIKDEGEPPCEINYWGVVPRCKPRRESGA